MNVYELKAKGDYCAGIAIVAAHNTVEAFQLVDAAVTDSWTEVRWWQATIRELPLTAYQRGVVSLFEIGE